MVATGKLQHWVTFNAPATSKDDYGEVTGDPAPRFSTWASVQAVTGSEKFLAGKVSAQTSHLVEIRWRDSVTPSWTVEWDDMGTTRVLDVESVTERGRREFLVLACVEQSAN